MTRTKSMFLAVVAVLLSPMVANAVPITIIGFGDADGTWDVTTLFCDRTQQTCIDELVGQVWYQDFLLAREFAAECFLCLDKPNQPFDPGTFTPWVNYAVSGIVLGWAFGFDDQLNAFSGGADEQFWMVAERVSVPEPSTLALLGLGLFGMGLARRRRKV